MTWLTNATNPANLVFMYFAEPDEHAHAFGKDLLHAASITYFVMKDFKSKDDEMLLVYCFRYIFFTM